MSAVLNLHGSAHLNTLQGFLLAMAFISLNQKAEGLSNGVPLSACSETERFHGVASQLGSPPYFTYPDKREVVQGDALLVTLMVKLRISPLTDQISFKGYLLMAYSEMNTPVGTFLEPSNGLVISCPNGPSPNNAVAHRWSDDKQFITVYWIAPEDYTGMVTFKTTFMKNGTIFWINAPASFPVRVFTAATSTSTSYSSVAPSTENIPLTSSTDEIVSAFTTDETFDNNTEDTIAFESTTLALPATTKKTTNKSSSVRTEYLVSTLTLVAFYMAFN